MAMRHGHDNVSDTKNPKCQLLTERYQGRVACGGPQQAQCGCERAEGSLGWNGGLSGLGRMGGPDEAVHGRRLQPAQRSPGQGRRALQREEGCALRCAAQRMAVHAFQFQRLHAGHTITQASLISVRVSLEVSNLVPSTAHC